jgi:hypothetical protein
VTGDRDMPTKTIGTLLGVGLTLKVSQDLGLLPRVRKKCKKKKRKQGLFFD